MKPSDWLVVSEMAPGSWCLSFSSYSCSCLWFFFFFYERSFCGFSSCDQLRTPVPAGRGLCCTNTPSSMSSQRGVILTGGETHEVCWSGLSGPSRSGSQYQNNLSTVSSVTELSLFTLPVWSLTVPTHLELVSQTAKDLFKSCLKLQNFTFSPTSAQLF